MSKDNNSEKELLKAIKERLIEVQNCEENSLNERKLEALKRKMENDDINTKNKYIDNDDANAEENCAKVLKRRKEHENNFHI